MLSNIKFIFALLIISIFIGCSQPKYSNNQKNLYDLLSKLNNKIDKKEAKKLSTSSLNYSNQLIKDYNLVTPPLYHNFLVNIGVKKRGLCWHFATDMLNNALKQNLKTFDYYIGGANINNYWQEHNTLVVTCKGCSFNKGIVLDPWRNSGKLFFSKVKNDKDYKWSQRGGLRR